MEQKRAIVQVEPGAYSISGKILNVGEIEQYDKFKRQSAVIKSDDESYPELLTIYFYNDLINFLTKFRNAKGVTIFFNLKGYEKILEDGESKYFNYFGAYRIIAYDKDLDENGLTIDCSEMSDETRTIKQYLISISKKTMPQEKFNVTMTSSLVWHVNSAIDGSNLITMPYSMAKLMLKFLTKY